MADNSALYLLQNIYDKIQKQKHDPEASKKILETFAIFVSMIGRQLKLPLEEACQRKKFDYQETLNSYVKIIEKIDQLISAVDGISDPPESTSLKASAKGYLLLLKATCYRFNNQIYFLARKDNQPFSDEYKKNILSNFREAYKLLSDAMNVIQLASESSRLLISAHVFLNRAAFYLNQQQKKELLGIEDDFELDCFASVNEACSALIKLAGLSTPQSNLKGREELIDSFFVVLDQLRDYYYQRNYHYHFRRIVTSLQDRLGIPKDVKKRFSVYFPELQLDDLISGDLNTLDSVKPFLMAVRLTSPDLDQIISGIKQDTETVDISVRRSDLESLLSKLIVIYQKFLRFINRYTPYIVKEFSEDKFAEARFNVNCSWLLLSHYLGSGYAYLAEMKKKRGLEGYGENCHASKQYFGQAIVIADEMKDSIVGSIGLAQSVDNITEVLMTAGIEASFEPVFKTAKAAMQNKVSLFSRKWPVEATNRVVCSKKEIIRNGFVVLGKLYDCYLEKMDREPAEFFAELSVIVSDCDDLKTKFDEFLSERVTLKEAVQTYVAEHKEGIASEDLEEKEEKSVPACRGYYYSFKEVKYLSPLEFAIASQEAVIEDLLHSRHYLIANRFLDYISMVEKEYRKLAEDEKAQEKQIKELTQIKENISVFREMVINLSPGEIQVLQRDILFDIQKLKGLIDQLLSDLRFDRCLQKSKFDTNDLDELNSLRFSALNAYDEALRYISDDDVQINFKKILIKISQCELALDYGSRRLPFDQENYDQEAIECIKYAIAFFSRMKDDRQKEVIKPHLSNIFGRIISFGYSGRMSRLSIRKLLEETESFWGSELNLHLIMSAQVYFPERSLLTLQSSAETLANQFTQVCLHFYQDYLLEVSKQSEEEQKRFLSNFESHQLKILEHYEAFHDVQILREGKPTKLKQKARIVNLDCAHQYMYLLLAMNDRMQFECSSDPTILSKAQDALDKAETIIGRLGEIFDFYLGQSELADERCRLLLFSNKKNNISDQSLTDNMISLVRASITHFVTALYKMTMEDETYKNYSEKKLDLLRKLYESRNGCSHQALVNLFGELRELSKIPSCIKNYINEVMGKELDDIEAAKKAKEAQQLKEVEEKKQLQEADKVSPQRNKRKTKNGNGLSREEREEKEKRKKEREEESARLEEERRQRIAAERDIRKKAKEAEKEEKRRREEEAHVKREAERTKKEHEREERNALEAAKKRQEEEEARLREEERSRKEQEEIKQKELEAERLETSTAKILNKISEKPIQPLTEEHVSQRNSEVADFLKIAYGLYPEIFTKKQTKIHGQEIYNYFVQIARQWIEGYKKQDYPCDEKEMFAPFMRMALIEYGNSEMNARQRKRDEEKVRIKVTKGM